MEAELLAAVWGKDIAQDVFQRWNQGFIFSSKEPLALVQYSGGPCAVLAPVQKHLFEDRDGENLDNEEWRKCESAAAQGLLISVLSHILSQASSDGTCKVALLDYKTTPSSMVTMEIVAQATPTATGGCSSSSLKRKHPSPLSEEKSDTKRDPPLYSPPLLVDNTGKEGAGTGCGLTLEALSSALRNVKGLERKEEGEEEEMIAIIDGLPMAPLQATPTSVQPQTSQMGSVTGQTGSTGATSADADSAVSDDKVIDNFHSQIKVSDCADVGATVRCLRENLSNFHSPFGVLLFLYSVLLTKGIHKMSEEREENEQPLIDPLHGHGSQNLINLILTGRCVTNVFDLDKDLGELLGIPRQATVGFLTVLESLNYCEVGSFLKSPRYPVWVIASETHLTVLFSLEIGLTFEEDAKTVAKREFSQMSLDCDSCMMAADKLRDLLQRLNLETDPSYVEYMKEKLDQDKAGIILLDDFLTEFYPFPMECEKPKAFTVYHYNGLTYNKDDEIQLSRGQAVALGEAGGTNTDITLINCLHTKWPDLIVHWDNQTEPKII